MLMRRLAEFLAWQGNRGLWELCYAPQRATARLLDPQAELDLLCLLLAGRGDLICLDDAHHLADDPFGALVLDRLATLAQTQQITLLLTSRRALPNIASDPPLNPLSSADAQMLIAQSSTALRDPLLCAQLVERVGSNVQCLLLAVRLLETAAQPAALIAALPATPQVADYLLQQILEQLGPAEQAVMEALAVLGSAGGSADAVEALLDRRAARTYAVAPTLLHLQRSGLLLSTLAGQGIVYYQHTLVQAFWYGMLNVARRSQLHRRAYTYAAQADDLLQATHHALAAGDLRQAAGYALTHAPRAPSQGESVALLSGLNRLASAKLPRAQQLSIALARGDLATGLRQHARAGSISTGARSGGQTHAGGGGAGVSGVGATYRTYQYGNGARLGGAGHSCRCRTSGAFRSFGAAARLDLIPATRSCCGAGSAGTRPAPG
jgi:hypothetical protein